MAGTLRAFGYVRVSVDEEGGNNASIAAQAAAIREHAARAGFEIVRIYEEPNVSGRKLNRRQFDQMIAAATSPERPVHAIIVYALSRFARRLLTQVVSEHKLTDAGIRLISITEQFGEDANGRLMRSMVAVMNEKYALDASSFTRRDRRGNARAGHWNGGPVPFGYEARTVAVDGKKERRRLFAVEPEAALVRRIYDLAEQGLDGTPMGTRSIAAHLNALGYTFRGKPFFHSNVDGILTREHYLGQYLDRTADNNGARPPDEDAIVVPCPRIVEPEQAARVAARRAKAAPRVTPPRITRSPILLTGLATCDTDGCGAGLAIRTGKGGRYSYYACNRKQTAGAHACGSKAIRQEELDGVMTGALLDRVLRPDRLKILLGDVLERSDAADQRRRKELQQVDRERSAAEARLKRLYFLVEEGLTDPRDAVFAGRLSEQKQAIAALDASRRSLEAQLDRGARAIDEAAVERFGTLVQQRLQADPQFRRAYVRLFVDQVLVSDDRINITGSKAALRAAIIAPDRLGKHVVPSFDREWCRLQDSNL